MVDAELTSAKLAELTDRIRRVRKHCPTNAEALLADRDRLDLVAFNLLLAVQTCLDIASHLISDQGWRPAETLAEAFQRLEEHAVLAPETAAAMARAVGLRNVVAHGYSRIQPGLLFEAATAGLGDLEAYAGQLSRWIEGG